MAWLRLRLRFVTCLKASKLKRPSVSREGELETLVLHRVDSERQMVATSRSRGELEAELGTQRVDAGELQRPEG